MVGVGPHSNLQSLDSYITNIRLCLCRSDIFEQYPWGRVAFVELVQQIKDATATKIKDDSYVCKGFVQVIQVWAYAYIPCLGEAIGRPIRSNGPCLLRFKGKYGKLPLGSILEKAKVTCMSP
ncbi:unnamed protein product [Brassica napus]|uniref:(rape) hypothetical protein n=1 Tax=Brassica napus TaxID=3708 RepID=A0A816RFR1_BRANA|nr:unnamed protein product [Brassica napus]